MLEYNVDPDPEEGFDRPTRNRVSFLNERELWDLDEECILHWRQAGEGWEPNAEPTDQFQPNTLEENGKSGAMYTIESLISEGRQIDALTGTTFSEEVSNAIHGMPYNLQRVIADRYSVGRRIFEDEIRHAMSRAREENGGIVDDTLMAEALKHIQHRISQEGGL